HVAPTASSARGHRSVSVAPGTRVLRQDPSGGARGVGEAALAAPLCPPMAAAAQPVEVVAAVHESAAAVKVDANLEPGAAARTPRAVVGERWERGDVDRRDSLKNYSDGGSSVSGAEAGAWGLPRDPSASISFCFQISMVSCTAFNSTGSRHRAFP